jgi:Rha family phage regulatory protein
VVNVEFCDSFNRIVLTARERKRGARRPEPPEPRKTLGGSPKTLQGPRFDSLLLLRVRDDGSVALVNSRDVAEAFDKRHDHVLRDIDAILTSPNLGASWFRSGDYLDAKGEARRSFDLTRQGFTLLVMGWTGERAMAFKIRSGATYARLGKPRACLTPVRGQGRRILGGLRRPA